MEPRVKAGGIKNESFGYHSGVWELTVPNTIKNRLMICMAVDPEMQAEDSAEEKDRRLRLKKVRM